MFCRNGTPAGLLCIAAHHARNKFLRVALAIEPATRNIFYSKILVAEPNLARK